MPEPGRQGKEKGPKPEDPSEVMGWGQRWLGGDPTWDPPLSSSGPERGVSYARPATGPHLLPFSFQTQSGMEDLSTAQELMDAAQRLREEASELEGRRAANDEARARKQEEEDEQKEAETAREQEDLEAKVDHEKQETAAMKEISKRAHEGEAVAQGGLEEMWSKKARLERALLESEQQGAHWTGELEREAAEAVTEAATRREEGSRAEQQGEERRRESLLRLEGLGEDLRTRSEEEDKERGEVENELKDGQAREAAEEEQVEREREAEEAKDLERVEETEREARGLREGGHQLGEVIQEYRGRMVARLARIEGNRLEAEEAGENQRYAQAKLLEAEQTGLVAGLENEAVEARAWMGRGAEETANQGPGGPEGPVGPYGPRPDAIVAEVDAIVVEGDDQGEEVERDDDLDGVGSEEEDEGESDHEGGEPENPGPAQPRVGGVCDNCGRNFPTEWRWVTHLTRRNPCRAPWEGRASCQLCDVSLSRPRDLMRHVRQLHGTFKTCPRCTGVFTHAEALQRHLNTTHPGA